MQVFAVAIRYKSSVTLFLHCKALQKEIKKRVKYFRLSTWCKYCSNPAQVLQ